MSKIKKIQIEDYDGNKYYPVTHSSLIEGLNESNDFEKTKIIDNPDINNMGDLKIINKEDIHDNNIHYLLGTKGTEIFRIENTSSNHAYLIEFETLGKIDQSIDYYYDDNDYEYFAPSIPPFNNLTEETKNMKSNKMCLLPPTTKASIGVDYCDYVYYEDYKDTRVLKLQIKRIIKVDVNNKKDMHDIVNMPYKYNSYFKKINNQHYELDTGDNVLNFSLVSLRNDNELLNGNARSRNLRLNNTITILDTDNIKIAKPIREGSKIKDFNYSKPVNFIDEVYLSRDNLYKGKGIVKLHGANDIKYSHTYVNGDIVTGENLIFFDKSEEEKQIVVFLAEDKLSRMYIKSDNEARVDIENDMYSSRIINPGNKNCYEFDNFINNKRRKNQIQFLKITFKGNLVLAFSTSEYYRDREKTDNVCYKEMSFWNNYSLRNNEMIDGLVKSINEINELSFDRMQIYDNPSTMLKSSVINFETEHEIENNEISYKKFLYQTQKLFSINNNTSNFRWVQIESDHELPITERLSDEVKIKPYSSFDDVGKSHTLHIYASLIPPFTKFYYDLDGHIKGDDSRSSIKIKRVIDIKPDDFITLNRLNENMFHLADCFDEVKKNEYSIKHSSKLGGKSKVKFCQILKSPEDNPLSLTSTTEKPIVKILNRQSNLNQIDNNVAGSLDTVNIKTKNEYSLTKSIQGQNVTNSSNNFYYHNSRDNVSIVILKNLRATDFSFSEIINFKTSIRLAGRGNYEIIDDLTEDEIIKNKEELLKRVRPTKKTIKEVINFPYEKDKKLEIKTIAIVFSGSLFIEFFPELTRYKIYYADSVKLLRDGEFSHLNKLYTAIGLNNIWERYDKDIDYFRKNIDSLKQSGTRINQKLVDNLATHNIEASTSNSIEENIDKILDIKVEPEKPKLQYPLDLLIINDKNIDVLEYDVAELIFSNSKTNELGVVEIDPIRVGRVENLLLGLEKMLKEELEYYDDKENILIILNIESYSKEIASFISASKLTRNMLVTHPFTKLTKAIANKQQYEEYFSILEMLVDDEVLENIENYSINFVDTY